MALTDFLSDKAKQWSKEVWDGLIRTIDARFKPLEEQLDAQRVVTDQVLARGLQVIEDSLAPVVAQAEAIVAGLGDALPAEVANQLPALADLLDTDIDLVAALAASTAFRDAVAGDPDLAAAVAADPDLAAALAGISSFVDAVAAALPINLNADNLASGTVPNARLPGRLQEVAQSTSDWNGALNSGFYRSYQGANEPIAAGAWLGIVRRLDARIYQEVFRVDTGAAVTEGAWYCRTSQNTGATWTAWQIMRPTEAQLNAKYARLASANTFTETLSCHPISGPPLTARASQASATGGWQPMQRWENKDGVTVARLDYEDNVGGVTHFYVFDDAGGGGATFAFSSSASMTINGNTVRTTGNTPDGSNALAIAGSDTTKRAWGADDLKAAAQTWGGGGKPDVVLDERQPSATAAVSGGTNGTWTIRNLNTETRDPGGLATLASNQFSFTKDGWVEWRVPGRDTHTTRLYNVTDGVMVELGSVAYSGAGYYQHSEGGCAVLAGKTYQLEQRGSGGLGNALSPDINLYSRLLYWAD